MCVPSAILVDYDWTSVLELSKNLKKAHARVLTPMRRACVRVCILVPSNSNSWDLLRLKLHRVRLHHVPLYEPAVKVMTCSELNLKVEQKCKACLQNPDSLHTFNDSRHNYCAMRYCIDDKLPMVRTNNLCMLYQ